jgi:hypothetical protein
MLPATATTVKSYLYIIIINNIFYNFIIKKITKIHSSTR